MRKNIRGSIISNNLKNKKEFNGLAGLVYSISEKLDVLLKSYDKKRYKNGNGASLLVLAIKK